MQSNNQRSGRVKLSEELRSGTKSKTVKTTVRVRSSARIRQAYADLTVPVSTIEELTDMVSRRIATEVTSVRELWEECDDFVRMVLLTKICFYIGRISDEHIQEEISQRRRLAVRNVSLRLKELEKLWKASLAFEQQKMQAEVNTGAVRTSPELSFMPASQDVLREIEKLSAELANRRSLANKKRFGIDQSHMSLVTAQEFVNCVMRLKGKRIQLGPEQIADLIDCILIADDIALEDFNRAENIRKALAHLRRHPMNQAILKLIESRYSLPL